MLHACLCTICFVFCYISWRFYAFSRTNLLTRCHSASSLFSAIFVFQKSYTGNIIVIGRNKSQSSYFSRHETESKVEMANLPPIYSPRRENPKDPNSFLENILQAAGVIDTRSGGSRRSSRHPIREGNHHRRPSSAQCLPPE
jgi:hypothetical protein